MTGASSGIGRATAILAGNFGARVALFGRNEEALRATLARMGGTGHSIFTHDTDDLDGISARVREAAAELGGLDSLVHCAGVHSAVPLKTIGSEEVMRLLHTNIASAVMFAKAFRAKQIPKRGPSIVLLSSAVGIVGQSGVSVYSATKGAIITLTKSLALELAREGIRVNCVAPGVVVTEMTSRLRARVGEEAFALIEAQHPLGLGEPDDVAKGVMYLVSDAARWVTGTSLVIDGGYTAQ